MILQDVTYQKIILVRKFQVINNLKVVMTVMARSLRLRESSMQNSQSSFRFGILRRIVYISANRLSHSFHFTVDYAILNVTRYTYIPGAFSIDKGITNVCRGIIHLIHCVVYGARPRELLSGVFLLVSAAISDGNRRVSQYHTTDVSRFTSLKLPRFRHPSGSNASLSRAISKLSYRKEASVLFKTNILPSL